MTRHDEPSKAAKTQRRGTLSSAKMGRISRHGGSAAAVNETGFAQLIRERDEALQQQAATSEVLSIIRRSPADAQPVFDAIVQSAARLCGAIFSILYLYNDNRMCIAATNNFNPEATGRIQEIQQLKRPERSHLAGRAILDRAIVHVHDVLADPEYSRELALAGGWRAVLSVPLLRDGKPVGALSVGKAEPKPYSDRQIQLLQTFADQALIAIENVRLFEAEQQRARELSESLEQQTATSEILEVISNSPTDTQPAFDAIVRSGLNLFPDAVVTISLPDRGSIKLGAIGGTDKAGVEALRGRFPMPLSREFITGTAILDRREIDIADAHEPPKELGAGAKNLLAGGYRAMTVMPMVRGDETIGTLNVVRRNPGPLSDKQRELLRTFANQAVIAIENTRLFNELRESLQQQTATADILATISSSQAQLKPVFETIVDRTTRICGATFACLGLFEGEALRFASISGASADSDFFHSERLHQPGGCPYVVPLARAKKTVQTPDLRAERGYLERDPFYLITADVGGARTALRVPLLKDDTLLGHLWAFRHEVRRFTDKQIELVQNFAKQAVIAIDNARLLNELRENLDRQTATADILRVIAGTPEDSRRALDTIAETASRMFDAADVNFRRLEGNVLRVVSAAGPSFAKLREVVPRCPARTTNGTGGALCLRE